MGRGPFGRMSQPSQILGCLLLVGWATPTIAESEKTLLCARSSSDDPAECSTVTSLPDHLICNLEPAAVNPLSQNEALTLAERISESCVVTHRKCPKPGEKRTLPFQVAAVLVRKFEDFPPETLASLGQVAVGLSVPQIESGIRDGDLLTSLPSLCRVRGWNAQQAEALLSKLFGSGYQIEDASSLAALGSLVVGLDPDRLQALPPSVVLGALKDPGFGKQLEKASPALKTAFVGKLIAATDGFKDLVESVPDALAPHVPKSLLVPSGEFSIQELTYKPWTREQAAGFFEDATKSVHNFNSLCASILHGFTCAAADSLDTERLRELAKAMKEKNVRLEKDQLLCLAQRLMQYGVPHDFHDYPEDLVLFVSPSDYGAIGSCKEYFAHVGKANVDVLEKDSPQRRQLLAEALDCLKISGPHVSRENAEILGHLACDLSAKYLKTSGKNLLKPLTECRSLSPDQATAIQALLCSGNTPAGPPSEWSSSTLEELSGLFHIFDHCILHKIPANVVTPWLKCFPHASHLHRKELVLLAKTLRSRRHQRSTDSQCPSGKEVTDETTQDDLMPVNYTPEELHACLGDEVLLRNLATLSHYAFTVEQQLVVKKRLDEIYPQGYPDEVLRNLGDFMVVMSPADIKKWNFNSTETLASLLEDVTSTQLGVAIIQQYLENRGPLNAKAVNVTSLYICLLDLEQLDEHTITCANHLNASSCNQTIQDILYRKAKRAFSDRHNPPHYYECIKPYLRVAPGEDLKALSKDNVNMDIDTFMHLKKNAVLKLTPTEVKALLGRNVQDLKKEEKDPFVQGWIVRQRQWELDRMGIGLRGGTPEGYMNITPRKNN